MRKKYLHSAFLSLAFVVTVVGESALAGSPPVTPVFLEDEIIFATLVATDPPFRADPTGQRDSTEAINHAMVRVRQLGGGTAPGFINSMSSARITPPASQQPLSGLC